MHVSEAFIRRPVATTLLTIGLALAGLLAYAKLPVSPLPQVDFPTIVVQAQLPGASPEVMATSVATPLERHLGQIADVSEMTSSSSIGSTRVVLQFGLSRDIDGAARDVQAAINAARADLPTDLRSNPTYRKVNPADAPIMVLTLTSDTLSQGRIYDAATTVLEQQLSQIEGIGQVTLGGSSLPAVRVELNPNALFKYGIGLEDVRAALAATNANSPKGVIEQGDRRFQIYTNDRAGRADQYRSIVIAYRNNAAVHLSDIADVVDSVENLRNQGYAGAKPAILVILYRQPGSNIIETVDRVMAVLPELRASIPAAIDLDVAVDRTPTIRASLHEVERTLLIATALVVMIIFLFLRRPSTTLIPAIAIPVSLLGTLGLMYLMGYSLDNLSLMALTVATGFVVDDAVVVLENATRHIEAGKTRLQAAVQGVREVGFTVVSMSLSLIAVFIPILLMGGIVGRLFREFAMTLSMAILVSMAVSLTTTPMLCAYMLRSGNEGGAGWVSRRWSAVLDGMMSVHRRLLEHSLRHPRLVLLLFFAVIGLNVYLFIIVPKGFFPQQDTGRMIAGIQADQSISFQAMQEKLRQFMTIVRSDPAVETAVGFTGGFQTNSGFLFVSLKDLKQRKVSADQVIARLRPKLARVAGARIFMQSVQDIRAGGRQSNAQFQYTLQGDDLAELLSWAPRVTEALQGVPQLADVNSDQQQGGLEIDLQIDRATLARYGLTMSQVNNTLYDAFGQRQVSTIYNPLNQYHVVMEVAPQYWQYPDTLNRIYVANTGAISGSQSSNASATTLRSAAAGQSAASSSEADLASSAVANQRANLLANKGRSGTSTGAAVSTRAEGMVPLSAFASWGPGTTPLAINHQGPFVATTLSFNLPAGVSLGTAVQAIDATMNRLGVPSTIHGSFQGTARVFQESVSNQPILILTALIAVYIVLGVLYESYIHPITILSTLPPAGIGAVLALMLCNMELSIIALIGIILLIGIVKKNAIMMVDFALDAARNRGLNSRDAIFEASIMRFRPIMMTTLAALFGAVPLALGQGDGAELRQPLGISIIGGLVVSQMLTLYMTPVIYLYLDRFRRRRAEPPARADAASLPSEGSAGS